MDGPGPNPRVGVAAIVRRRDGCVVLGRRKASHGAGQWAFPGGHLEFGESFTECAERETLEETGLKVKGGKILSVTNDVFTELNKHYITIFVLCEMLRPDQEPQLLEPDKCETWLWKTFSDIKEMKDQDLFLPIINFLKDLPVFGEASDA